MMHSPITAVMMLVTAHMKSASHVMHADSKAHQTTGPQAVPKLTSIRAMEKRPSPNWRGYRLVHAGSTGPDVSRSVPLRGRIET
jgi:hypothetical protein